MSTLTTPSSNDVNSKRERRKEARPGELLQAALELFVEKGYAATRAEEVATRAGVSKGTLFLYFSSKEDLFKAVIQSNLSRHFMAWNQEFDGFEGSSADMLAYGLTSWWTQIGSTLAGGITKLVMSEARNFPEIAAFYEREVVKPGQHLIERILQRGIDQGEFRAMDVHHVCMSLVSAMMFLMMWKHSLGPCSATNPSFDPETFLLTHLNTLLNGLLQPAPRGTLR